MKKCQDIFKEDPRDTNNIANEKEKKKRTCLIIKCKLYIPYL